MQEEDQSEEEVEEEEPEEGKIHQDNQGMEPSEIEESDNEINNVQYNSIMEIAEAQWQKVKGKKRRRNSPSISNGITIRETQIERQIATRSSTKGKPTLGKVRIKEIERNKVEGTQGTLNTFGGKTPSKKYPK